jgi:hypothetical protein
MAEVNAWYSSPRDTGDTWNLRFGGEPLISALSFRPLLQQRGSALPDVKYKRAANPPSTSEISRSEALSMSMNTNSARADRRRLGHDSTMHAYKFLRYDGTTLLTGFRWPAQEWVEAEGPLGWCENGIHA